MAERVAEALPGLLVAGHAVGLQNVRQMMHDSQQRVRDSHRAMASAAGMEDVVNKDADPMGDIIITGDITGADAKVPWARKGTPAAPPPVEPTVPAPPAASGPPAASPEWALWKKLALGAALAAGGAGGGAAIPLLFGKDTPQIQYELKVLPPEKLVEPKVSE